MKWWYILIFAGLLVFRFAYLDQDAPVWEIGNINQEDEPYYSEGAILKLCADEGRTVKGFERAKGEPNDMYNKPLAYACLKVFGNNYWGLRVPDVIASVLFLLLIFSVFKTISPGNKFIPVMMVILFTNFYLFVYSRYNNPEIYSIVAITLTLWVFTRYGYEKPLPLIISGLVASFSVLFVYPMNLFLPAALGLFILIKAIVQKKFALPLYFFAGCVCCSLFLLLCLWLIGSSVFLKYGSNLTYANSYDIFTDTHSVKSVFMNFFRSITSVTNTGYFRYQLPLLIGIFAAIPILVFKARNKNDANGDLSLLILLLIAIQLVQNYFIVSFPFKKMIVVLPVTAIAIFLAAKDSDFKSWIKTKSQKMVMALFLIAGLGLCLFNFKANKSHEYWWYTGVGCFGTTPAWFDALNILACVLLAATLLYTVFFTNKLNKAIVISALAISILTNLAFAAGTFVINRKYQVRDCLISLEPMLHNKVVIYSYPFAYQFYTGCKPAFHQYPVDFINTATKASQDSMLTNKIADYLIEKVTPYQLQNFGKNPNLELIKVCNFDCYRYYLYKNKND
ncbi:MAG: ArnT family glycosyltransferase [Bacteroidia bacterium]